MGMVLHLVYPSHTAYLYHGVMGIDGIFCSFLWRSKCTFIIYATWEFGVSTTSHSLPNLGSLFVSVWNSLFVVDFDVSTSLLLVPVESTSAFIKPVIMEIDVCAIATLTGKAINCKVKYRCKGRDPGQGRVSELTIIMCCLNWLSLCAITPGLRTQYLTGKTITKVESADTIDIVKAKF